MPPAVEIGAGNSSDNTKLPAAIGQGSEESSRPPWQTIISFLAAIISVLGMSCGALLFSLMGHEVPGALKSAWRLLFMAILQTPLAVREYYYAPDDVRVRWRASVGLLFMTGALSALNYVSFTVCLDIKFCTVTLGSNCL